MNYYAISNIPGYNFLGTKAVTQSSLNNENVKFQSNKAHSDTLSLFGHYIPRMASFTGDETKGNKLNFLG